MGMDAKTASRLKGAARFVRETISTARALVSGNKPPQPQLSDYARSFVCSDFIYAVFDELFQHKNPCNYPGGHPAPVMMPCAFFSNPNFQDVNIDASRDAPELGATRSTPPQVPDPTRLH